MAYTGTVVNGVVVLEPGITLPEGVRVRVEPVLQQPSVHFQPVGEWDGPPGEFDRLLREIEEQRAADISADRP